MIFLTRLRRCGFAASLILSLLSARICAGAPPTSISRKFAGVNPFVSILRARTGDVSKLDYVRFTVAPKPGSVTRAVSAQYSSAYLAKRGEVNAASGLVKVPVFGLYENYVNSVTLVFGFTDGTTQTLVVPVTTAHYAGGLYRNHKTVQARTNTPLSYDFFLMKTTAIEPNPKVLDTDGEIRWVGTDRSTNSEFFFRDNGIFCVGASNTTLQRQEFDGTSTDVADYAAMGVTSFHHNFDTGKTGILAGVNTADYAESVVMEIDTTGTVLHTWNLADIITQAMVAGGDDPTQFVAAAGSLGDWFHNNCSAYRPSDDSLVVSSRENFVIALDYETGAIKWIFGDPTKQWYQFPSLRKYALTAAPGTTYPIGQHGMSFVRDRLLLFDNGYKSVYHTPVGANRPYSAPRKYLIDQAAGTATEVWHYLSDPAIDSPITSSVYEDLRNNYLIDYATAGPYLSAEVIGLAPGGVKVFDYKFREVDTAQTAWNCVVLHLENLVFQ